MNHSNEQSSGQNNWDDPPGYIFNPKIPVISIIILSILMVFLLNQVTGVSAGKNLEPKDEPRFIAPYDNYIITQDLHGFSYGHMAIDLSAGKGAVIKSPISGIVSEKHLDGLGNSTLVIENDVFRVTLLHGNYSVSKGDEIIIGQSVGSESNIGYTTDMQGISCKDRRCGYHTHLNVFNKKKSKNVNPLLLIIP
jgi:murein DD-endopeptidase MepM/ murein hydrolase activator NlpD